MYVCMCVCVCVCVYAKRGRGFEREINRVRLSLIRA